MAVLEEVDQGILQPEDVRQVLDVLDVLKLQEKMPCESRDKDPTWHLERDLDKGDLVLLGCSKETQGGVNSYPRTPTRLNLLRVLWWKGDVPTTNL